MGLLAPGFADGVGNAAIGQTREPVEAQRRASAVAEQSPSTFTVGLSNHDPRVHVEAARTPAPASRSGRGGQLKRVRCRESLPDRFSL
jgi:hypothetical protein